MRLQGAFDQSCTRKILLVDWTVKLCESHQCRNTSENTTDISQLDCQELQVTLAVVTCEGGG